MGVSGLLRGVVSKPPTAGNLWAYASSAVCGIINYGRRKMGGGHDHRTNTGSDRTPSQKEGDKKRRKKD